MSSTKTAPDRSGRLTITEALAAVSQVCDKASKRIRSENLAENTDSKAPTPLYAYTDLIVIGGIEYKIDVRPNVSTFPDCAQAETYLKQTLRWEEKPDRWIGYHYYQKDLRLAEVRK
jgi:hypothetical protein